MNNTVLAYNKTIKVIQSCKTLPQLTTAAKYVNLFDRKYGHHIPESYRLLVKNTFRKRVALIKRLRLFGKRTQSDKINEVVYGNSENR